jgi:hypothetical protein
MESFRPPLEAMRLPDSVERLPFDIVRALVGARQAATPTAHVCAGLAIEDKFVPDESALGLLRFVHAPRSDAMASAEANARFAICSVGRVVCTDRGVSA